MVTVEIVQERLTSLGYVMQENDDKMIGYAIGNAEQSIKHFCNICYVPECLDYVLIDRACGEFLQLKKSFGQLSSLQVEPVVKSVQDGDTNVEYNVSYLADPEASFKEVVEKMRNSHEWELVRHRRVVW